MVHEPKKPHGPRQNRRWPSEEATNLRDNSNIIATPATKVKLDTGEGKNYSNKDFAMDWSQATRIEPHGRSPWTNSDKWSDRTKEQAIKKSNAKIHKST